MILQAFWASRWWFVAFGFALAGMVNAILNSGYFKINSGQTVYWYYFGGDSAAWGLVAGILVGVLYSKVKIYIITHGVIVVVRSTPKPQLEPPLETEP